jgi:hypothetical protein
MIKPPCLLVAAALLALASSSWATTIDFTQLPSLAGSQGSSLSFNGLTVTAKTGMGNVNLAPNPWSGGYNAQGAYRPGMAGVAGQVYWGDLGALGAINSTTTTTTWNATHTISTTKVIEKENIPPLASNYTGLGVVKASELASSTTGPITVQEALVFDFAPAQAATLTFSMLGVNGGNLRTTTTTTVTNTRTGAVTTTRSVTQTANDPGADNVRVFLKVASGEVLPFDVSYGAVPADGSGWNALILWALNQVSFVDERIVGLALEQTYGSTGRQFGVGSITYDAAVPEPSTMLLFGLGVLGLIGARRKLHG